MEVNREPVLDWNLVQLFWLFLSRIFTEAEESFERGSIGLKQIILLAILEKPQSPLDLRRMLGGPASTMSNTINDLEKKGLVVRSLHATDKRSLVIHRTLEGDKVLQAAIGSVEVILQRMSAILLPDQLAAMGATKETLASLLHLGESPK